MSGTSSESTKIEKTAKLEENRLSMDGSFLATKTQGTENPVEPSMEVVGHTLILKSKHCSTVWLRTI